MSALCSPWAGIADVKALGGKYAAVAEADVAPFLMPASEILWRMSGRRWFGECVATGLRPCKRTSSSQIPGMVDPAATWGNVAWSQRAMWWGRTCGCSWNACGCEADWLDLGEYAPVQSVEQVKIDGVVLASTAYVLYDRRTLVRTDGGYWPTFQALELADTEPGTWSIDLTSGSAPPPDGVLAAACFAAELALAFNPTLGSCALPERVQTVTRQGVTYLVSDPQDYLAEGRLGIYLIDVFLRSANPDGRRASASLGYLGMDAGPRHRT
jgi:hypothetical protein